MKQLCKRLIAVFCALMIVSGSIFTVDVLQAEAEYNVLFSDDFDSYGDNTNGSANKDAMIAKGWGLGEGNMNNTIGNFNRGEYYRVPYNGRDGEMATFTMLTSGVSGASEWDDYSVEATMKFEYEEGMTGTTTASVGGRIDGLNGYFLEVTQAKPTNSGAKVRIRRYPSKELVSYNVTKFDLNTEFTLKLEFVGTVLNGYYNGQCVVTYDTKDDTTKYAKGCAGIRKTTSTGCNVIWDDFVVKEEVPDAPVVYPDGYFYWNDFSSDKELKQEGWTGNGTKVNQAFQLPAGSAGYLRDVSGSINWTDYIVEADVTLSSGTATEGIASIIARSTDTSRNGYEYRMSYKPSGTSLVLYKRATSGKTLATYNISFELDTAYKMTMAVKGNNIMCWFGDTLVFDYVDSTDPYLTGYTGVRAPGSATNLSSIYDNYAVREYEEPTVVYPDGYFYYNDFESPRNLMKDGWNHDGTKENGVYVLAGGAANYLRDLEGSSEWTDYVVEADVMTNGDGSEDQFASIIGRSTDTTKSGYEYRLTQKASGETYVVLYKRGASGGKINKLEHKFNVSVIPGEMNHLKLVLNGATITCYFNGMKLMEVVDSDPYLTGYAGVRSPSGTVTGSYDNFAVREIRDTDIVTEEQLQKQDGTVWFYDDFTADSSFTERGWDTDDVELYDSTVNLNGRLAVSGIEGSDKWTDYQVEAIVSVDKNGGLIGDATLGWAAICTRTTSKTTGYEFGIITPSSAAAYLRLYDRANKENIAVDKTVMIEEGEHKLTMACVGNVITCYFDGTLIFTAQNDTATAGTAALRSSGYPTYYKSISVGEVVATSVVVPPSADNVIVSPATGDWMDNMTGVSMVVFVVSAVGLIITIWYKRKLEA